MGAVSQLLGGNHDLPSHSRYPLALPAPARVHRNRSTRRFETTETITFLRNGKETKYDVGEALAAHLEVYAQRYEGRGVIEALDDKIEALTKAVGVLAGVLIERGLITNDDINNMLDWDLVVKEIN